MSAEESTAPVEYRLIVGHELYRVGSDGSVWSRHSGEWKRLRAGRSRNGYLSVRLCRDGSGKTREVHRLVLTAFRGDCPSGCEAAHGNGIKSDNSLLNLSWKSHHSNIGDQIRHGTRLRGELSPGAKLTSKMVSEVVALLQTTSLSPMEIAKKFRVSRHAVQGILDGSTWVSQTGGPIERKLPRGRYVHSRAKLSDGEVAEIRTEAALGVLQKTLAKKYGVSGPHISDIINGRRRVAASGLAPRRSG